VDINTDINVLGSIQDFTMVHIIFHAKNRSKKSLQLQQQLASLKVAKTFDRYENAIQKTFLSYKNDHVKTLFQSILSANEFNPEFLPMLFWNASINNQLINYLNQNVYFPALYSGRTSIKNIEVESCIKDLRKSEQDLQTWSDNTIATIGSKYLTFLRKFHLMEGTQKKKICPYYLNDRWFVLFLYFFKAVDPTSNILQSPWLPYSFLEKDLFIERVIKKQFSKYYHFTYNGEKLALELLFSFGEIYHELD
jgi:hypothetical protein